MPVQGMDQMRISGVLKKMAGYECRTEDLEFLKHMLHQEKIKVLKKEFLSVKKDLAAANQNKELVLAKKENIEEMKLSYERTVKLGRGLLSRMQDPTRAAVLSPDDVIKQLNPMTIHTVHQQTRLQLAAAEKELARRRQEAADRRSETENRSLALKLESSEHRVKEVQCRIQQLKEEVMRLTTQIRQVQENKLELEASLQKKREEISCCQEQATPSSEMSEEEEERLIRTIQRLLHRRDNYLERERIIQKLRKELQ
ncbi:tropomyosin Tod p 1.0102-like [Dendropsophus ebraccatus]|uniref:tropomyosin Tod p 1.0102-like n=1 Tax=Dendropsophus ebraccatus TaxID=150705 RepID=UPI003831E3B9